jgi:hypothetical protein
MWHGFSWDPVKAATVANVSIAILAYGRF